MTTGKAARICGVGLNTIKSWIRSGHIKAIQLPSGHWRISAAELDRFLASAGQKNGPEEERCVEPAAAAESFRILVVDDDPHIHSFVEDACMMGGINAEFVFAHDGYAGLIEIGRFTPHLLVLDIMMPEINGLELIERIKKDAELAATMSTLVLTGAQDRRLVMQRLSKAGPDAVLHKPVAVPTLVETIGSLLMAGKQQVVAHGC
ncbi:response regulator [Mariprofundus erugo]|uniref:Response regulator n=1 Tax=Mariprofundus erugo TaxID=2528639 RepID=A0A5R9GX90_9PROT|nr:response regulator [Mariprofundus erugo]TLS67674.1 response regulator [Mariprofundus erugo]TLS76253.1 response regulator [Mariprofundus erugo]